MNKYFAASNSANGFKSYYKECFSCLDKLYIIKGGPGTGKSSLMRRVANAANDRGYFTESFYCSSDQSSLDGIIIYKDHLKFGIIDGTSPHSYDMKYAGIIDNIINLGEFWDENMLCERRDEIINLSGRKNHEYNLAYHYLCSCANLCAVISSQLEYCSNKEKMHSAVKKLLADIPIGEGYSEKIRLIDSIGMRGRVRFDSFEKNADKIFIIGDRFGFGSDMLGLVRRELWSKGRSVMLSYDPICSDRINGIFDIESKYAFVLSDERGADSHSRDRVKHINVKRFMYSERINEIKADVKYANSLYKNCILGAMYHFENIEKIHFELEKIYSSAMDFSRVDILADGIINKI